MYIAFNLREVQCDDEGRFRIAGRVSDTLPDRYDGDFGGRSAKKFGWVQVPAAEPADLRALRRARDNVGRRRFWYDAQVTAQALIGARKQRFRDSFFNGAGVLPLGPISIPRALFLASVRDHANGDAIALESDILGWSGLEEEWTSEDEEVRGRAKEWYVVSDFNIPERAQERAMRDGTHGRRFWVDGDVAYPLLPPEEQAKYDDRVDNGPNGEANRVTMTRDVYFASIRDRRKDNDIAVRVDFMNWTTPPKKRSAQDDDTLQARREWFYGPPTGMPPRWDEGDKPVDPPGGYG